MLARSLPFSLDVQKMWRFERACVSWRNPKSLPPGSATKTGRAELQTYADDDRQNHGVRDQMFLLEWKVEAPQHGDSEGENLMRLTWLHVPLLRIRFCLQIEAALGRERENNSAFDVQQRTGHTEGCDAPVRNTPADIAHEARGVWTSR